MHLANTRATFAKNSREIANLLSNVFGISAHFWHKSRALACSFGGARNSSSRWRWCTSVHCTQLISLRGKVALQVPPALPFGRPCAALHRQVRGAFPRLGLPGVQKDGGDHERRAAPEDLVGLKVEERNGGLHCERQGWNTAPCRDLGASRDYEGCKHSGAQRG